MAAIGKIGAAIVGLTVFAASCAAPRSLGAATEKKLDAVLSRGMSGAS